MIDILNIIIQANQAPIVTRTWGGGSGSVTGKWSDPSNWTDDTIPGSNDRAILDSTDTTNCNIDKSIAIRSIALNSGFTGTLSVTKGKTVTINEEDGLTINAGTVNLDGGTWNVG